MRKFVFALASLVLVAAVAPAQTVGTQTKTITGVVESTVWVRQAAPLYTYLKITVVADGGEKVVCFVLKGTDQTLTDGTVDHGNAVIKGQHVELTYATISGGNEYVNGANAAVTLKHLD